MLKLTATYSTHSGKIKRNPQTEKKNQKINEPHVRANIELHSFGSVIEEAQRHDFSDIPSSSQFN